MTTEMQPAPLGDPGASSLTPLWSQRGSHLRWLEDQADRLFRFYEQACVDPKGGYFAMDGDGRPQADRVRDLVGTGRMVFCFSLGSLLGRPGAAVIADHGIRFLTDRLHDDVHGGYVWTWQDGEARDDHKMAYGHAFVLLAGATATAAGRPGANELMADAATVLHEHFWSEAHGLHVDEYNADWSVLDPYRGQNSNMHLVEALSTAAAVTGDLSYANKAARIADFIVNKVARSRSWRIHEHFDERWQVDSEYNLNDPDHMYRPYGTVPGHSCEWARLLLQLHFLKPEGTDWMLDAAAELVDRALADAFDRDGEPGMIFSVDADGVPRNRDRYWWCHAEAIGALTLLGRHFGPERYEEKYRRVWDFIQLRLIDGTRGGWHHALDAAGTPHTSVWKGKPDLYHSLQACLMPLYAKDGTNLVLSVKKRS
jgi:mannose/cellobiose epimerase-like protein (N-acyl-D-glucosamine 2-epimerase family)